MLSRSLKKEIGLVNLPPRISPAARFMRVWNLPDVNGREKIEGFYVNEILQKTKMLIKNGLDCRIVLPLWRHEAINTEFSKQSHHGVEIYFPFLSNTKYEIRNKSNLNYILDKLECFFRLMGVTPERDILVANKCTPEGLLVARLAEKLNLKSGVEVSAKDIPGNHNDLSTLSWILSNTDFISVSNESIRNQVISIQPNVKRLEVIGKRVDTDCIHPPTREERTFQNLDDITTVFIRVVAETLSEVV